MKREKSRRGEQSRRGTKREASKLISLHRRYFAPVPPTPQYQGENYSLDQPFPFPSVLTVTTTSTSYAVPHG